VAAPRAARTPDSGAPSRLASATNVVRGALAGAVSAVAERLPGRSRPSDALSLLEKDHRRLEALLKRGDKTSVRSVVKRAELLKMLTAELDLHERLEEHLLYPALQAHAEAKAIVLEGYQEHHVADLIVKELNALATDDAQWGAKFTVLKENIEHHIEEEEGEMFRTARAVMTRDELQRLGAQMAQMKAE
jgi:hypothetical protein